MGDIGRTSQAIASLGTATIGLIGTKYAADAQLAGVNAGIDEQKTQFDKTQANAEPWLEAGRGALSQLTAGTAPGGALVTPYGEKFDQPAPFTAPTLDNTNDPGYAFRLQQGEQALQRGASASGGAFSGGTLKALSRYGQDYASNEYSNVYNRALTGYQTNFNDSLQGYNTRANAYNIGQSNTFNRLSSIAGTGQTATAQLAQAGQATAGAISDLSTQGGNATAAGIIGGVNAANSGINSYQNGQLLSALTGGNGSTGPNGGYVGYSAPSNGYYENGGA